jgi:hypothetical protein
MIADSLESRIDLSEQLVYRHAKLIRDTRYEAAHRLADLEKQISRLKRLIVSHGTVAWSDFRLPGRCGDSVYWWRFLLGRGDRVGSPRILYRDVDCKFRFSHGGGASLVTL